MNPAAHRRRRIPPLLPAALLLCSAPLMSGEEPGTAPAADTAPAPAVILPVGAGEAVRLPGPPAIWKQLEGPPVTAVELDGVSTWRLFQPGVYRMALRSDPAPQPPPALTAGAWRVYPGSTAVLGDRRPEVTLPASLDGQAGHPLLVPAIGAQDPDHDPLTYRFRILKTRPADLDLTLHTRESVDRCVLESRAPGEADLECRVYDGRLFSHPAVTRVVFGAPRTQSELEQTVSVAGVDLPFDEWMELCAKRTRIPIVFQTGFPDKRRPLTLVVTDLPFLRMLDLVAWHTGAQYRLERLPGEGAPDRTAVVWLNGWDELRREPLVAGDFNLADFARQPDGRDIAAAVTDLVREALAAQPTARCHLHGRDAELSAAVYLPKSAHDRLTAAWQALNRPQRPRPAADAAAVVRACRLKLELRDLPLTCREKPLRHLLPLLQTATGLHWLCNPHDLAVASAATDTPAAALPISLSRPDATVATALADLLTQANASRHAFDPSLPPLRATCWTPTTVLIGVDPPLPELSNRLPGPGQWLWQSATVQAYDLGPLLTASGASGEWVEHRIRAALPAEFRDPAAHISWWPRKQALLVVQRPTVQAAVANLLIQMQQEERSELHTPAAAPATATSAR